MRYEEVVVGADIGQSEFVITPEMQRDCIEALEDNNTQKHGVRTSAMSKQLSGWLLVSLKGAG